MSPDSPGLAGDSNDEMPGIVVLMATYNGLTWLPAQVRSILAQEHARVKLIVSDDASTDGSREWLAHLATQDSRVTLLPPLSRIGSSAGNFYRLIRDADWEGADGVAFSDQDDEWYPDKLARQYRVLRQGCDATSSNVMAVWPDGRQRLIDKAQSQCRLDFVFGSAGPGCTYLVTPRLLEKVRSALMDPASPARHCDYHDWLIYAVARTCGFPWRITNEPTLNYRQHENNVLGAHVGWRQKWRRVLAARSGWYRSEVSKIVGACIRCCDDEGLRSELRGLARDIASKNNVAARFRLLCSAVHGRRRVQDRLALQILILSGLW